MKTGLLLNIMAFAVLAMLVSCGGKSEVASSEEEQNVEAAVETAQAEEAVEETVEFGDEYFITPDLAFMEVFGHVKSIKYTNGAKAEFDTEGNLVDYATQYSGGNEVMINRDDDGFIISTYDGPGGSAGFDYDRENMRRSLSYNGDGAYSSEFKYVYNEEGDLIRFDCIDVDEVEETSNEYEIEVKILSRDDRGNWTKRKYGEVEEERTIVYY